MNEYADMLHTFEKGHEYVMFCKSTGCSYKGDCKRTLVFEVQESFDPHKDPPNVIHVKFHLKPRLSCPTGNDIISTAGFNKNHFDMYEL